MKNNTILNTQIWGKIKRELHPSHLFRSKNLMPAVISGALIGFMTTLLSISFAVLVFGKAIPEALSIGIGMALFSNVIFHLGSALGSSGEGLIYHVQSLPPPIQAVMLSAIISMLPVAMPIENKIAVTICAVWFSAIFTGVVLFFLGYFKFGRLVRFLPLPVISGFLASVGVALALGGIKTMVKTDMGLASLAALFNTELIFGWLPGIALAAVLWFVTARWKHELIVPNTLGIAVLLFYGAWATQGLSISDMMGRNLLLGPFPNSSFLHSPYDYYSQVSIMDWSIIASQIGIVVTIPLVCFVGGLLMLSAIEFSTGSIVEPNFELQTMGISNFISGVFGGGFVGYPSTTFTVMQHNIGDSTRLSGILSAIIPMVALVAGASFLGFIPRFVVGGLLIYFGYQFIDYWVIKQLRHASLPDICIIGAIVVTSLWFGFLVSVAVGIGLAVSFFLFRYSQTPVIRYVSTAATFRSRVTRNAVQEDWLSAHADSISIFGLQGYIFFGTAYSLHEQILLRVTDMSQKHFNCVIVDFSQVTGVDTSVVQSFNKLYQQLLLQDITLVFVQLPSKYQGLMQKIGLAKELTKGFAEFSSLDEALEWRENFLLANSELPTHQPRSMLTVFSEHFKDAAKAALLLPYLERMEVAPNSKIIEQNTEANDLFFIESGKLSAYVEQEGSPSIRLQTMVEGTTVGEIGFYLGELRTATVIAEAPSIVYRLTKNALAQLEKEQPIVAMALHKLLVEKTAKRVHQVSKSVKGFM